MTDVPKQEGPRVYPEVIKKILSECQGEIIQPEGRTTTFVHIYDKQGYLLATGMSACVDPANYDADKGVQIAQGHGMDNAHAKLWELEGYHLKKDLEAGRYVLKLQEHLLPPPAQRLIIQHNETVAQLANLQAFLNSPTSKDLATEQRNLLIRQAGLMTELADVLNTRFKMLQQV